MIDNLIPSNTEGGVRVSSSKYLALARSPEPHGTLGRVAICESVSLCIPLRPDDGTPQLS